MKNRHIIQTVLPVAVASIITLTTISCSINQNNLPSGFSDQVSDDTVLSSFPTIPTYDLSNAAIRLARINGGTGGPLVIGTVDMGDMVFDYPVESADVYINEYAFGQGGPMFELDDNFRNTLRCNIDDFIDNVFPEEKDVSIITDDYNVHCVLSDETEVWSSANCISLLVQNEFEMDMTKESLMNSDLVRCLLKYSGINDPNVVSMTVYDTKGEASEQTYQIFDTDDGGMFSISFRSITVSIFKDENSAVIRLMQNDIDKSQIFREMEVIPFSSIVSELQALFPDLDFEGVKYSLYYSSSTIDGMFIPCCRFYVDTGYFDALRNTEVYYIIDTVIIDISQISAD